jgi:hypothetical protein
MKKRILGTLVLTATIFTGCGGGGGGSSTTTSYDFYSYLVNPEILTNDKVVSAKYHDVTYLDGVQDSTSTDNILSQKYDDNSIEEYYYMTSSITNTTEYYNNISSQIASSQYDISGTKIVEIDLYDSSQYDIKRIISIGDKISENITNTGSTYTCNFSKHYDSINIKDTIESFYNTTSYASIDKTYSDVLELICTDSLTDEENYVYFSKNIGLIFGMYNETETSGEKENFIKFLTSYYVIDK